MAVSVRAFVRRVAGRRRVRLGSLRRTTPVSEHWGADRGQAIDRYYIERFLSTHRRDIRGRVLEVRDPRYTKQFASGVSQSDVLDIDSTNRLATMVADLASASNVPSDCFDCFICAQTLQFIYDVQGALRESHRLLRPGGVLLATVASVSKVDHHAGVDGDFWRLTTASCSRLFGGIFGSGNVEVRAFGNVLAAIGFLTGLAREDLTDAELDVEDELFPVLIGVRAVKAHEAVRPTR
jgi:SAM-dependent methyltransferase